MHQEACSLKMPSLQLVIRDTETLLSIIYDPLQKDPSEPGSYESCRIQIDNARDNKTISQASHNMLIRKINRIRRICALYNIENLLA